LDPSQLNKYFDKIFLLEYFCQDDLYIGWVFFEIMEPKNELTKREKVIVDLCRSDSIRGKLDLGLSGTTFIDHLVGLTETALKSSPSDDHLRAGYEALQKQYPAHFRNTTASYEGPTFKPQSYKNRGNSGH